MRLATACLVVSLALVCAGCGAPQLSVSAGGARDWTDRSWLGLPGYGRSPLHPPPVACDRFGRCWEVGPFDRDPRSYVARKDAEPPGWAEDLPGSARTDDRFLRPRSEVVCDRATSICYKRGRVDQSDTDDVFGSVPATGSTRCGTGTARRACSCPSAARPATVSAASASRRAIPIAVDAALFRPARRAQRRLRTGQDDRSLRRKRRARPSMILDQALVAIVLGTIGLLPARLP